MSNFRKNYLILSPVSLSLLLFVSAFTTVGCGGGSSSDSDTQLLRIVSPSDDSVFSPGEMMELVVETRDFTLRAPGDLASNVTQGSVGTLARELHPLDSIDSELDSRIAQAEVSKVGSNAKHSEGEHSDAEHSDDEHSEGEHANSHSDHEHPDGEHGHSHSDDDSQTNPFADGGHMHIYLNDTTGRAPHITSWVHTTRIDLPSDLPLGMHTLRIELRDDSHVLVGAEHDRVLFFEVRQ